MMDKDTRSKLEATVEILNSIWWEGQSYNVYEVIEKCVDDISALLTLVEDEDSTWKR